jgi:ABC-2 type transport system permease protein
LRKTLGDARLLLLASAGTLFAFSWIRVLIVASMEAGRFQKIVYNLPDVIIRLSPVPIRDLISYPGLIGFTFEEPVVYLIMAVWTISRASDCVSGELGRGTLEMILSQPISRSHYLFTHTLVTSAGILLLSGAVFAGTSVGIKTARVDTGQNAIRWQVPIFGFEIPVNDRSVRPATAPLSQFVSPWLFVPSTINYVCLGVFLTGVTLVASSVDRFRWRTIGIVVAFYVFQTILELIGMAMTGMRWLLSFTFFSAYEPVAIATGTSRNSAFAWRFLDAESSGFLPDLGPLGFDALLLAIGISGMGLAAWIFRNRDLPAPL